jgi:hypothetical protein
MIVQRPLYSLGVELTVKIIDRITVGLAILRITKHRVGSKGCPTALGGEPAYKHKYLIL